MYKSTYVHTMYCKLTCITRCLSIFFAAYAEVVISDIGTYALFFTMTLYLGMYTCTGLHTYVYIPTHLYVHCTSVQYASYLTS